MPYDALLLIGRDTPHNREVFETHADRLRTRNVFDSVYVVLYDREPAAEISAALDEISADAVYAVPMTVAHTHDTTGEIPAALAAHPADVRYCEPVGRDPAVTDALADRADACRKTAGPVSLVLVGFGNSSLPYHRQVVEYHAARLRECPDYDEVTTCYVVQNPAVECARYNVSNDSAVAVPLFLVRCPATEEKIPAKLELDRGGVEYADPLGTHSGLTDAVHASAEESRIRATTGDDSPSFEASFVADARLLATDGRGHVR